MARYIGPKAKLSRREGTDLFLKSARRSLDSKCKLDVKPGQHGAKSGARTSDFGNQLREKQKVKRMYGVLERQFRRYYEVALQRRGLTGLNLLQILESRFDNVVYRLGFAANRAQARVLVTHGHFTVNGRRTDVPSMLLREGDIIGIRDGSRGLTFFKELGDLADARTSPSWLNRDTKQLSGNIQRLPERAEIDGFLNEQLIVEYYSR